MVQTLNSPLYFHYLLASYQEMTHTCAQSKGGDMHIFRVQDKGIQLNFDTSWMPMYISIKPDSKAQREREGVTCRPYLHLTEPEMKGFTQIEGQSTQGFK